ncbi:cysteine dioxygenase [Rhodococcus sp. D2-41]|uniref:Cysteine dioxygenase family protein n=1 Tax=Speluncibacter jeojiensis TaxID=2710754 RepID=A0A9X4M4M0_9ACTN|nr:cysteine dioxygenase family protein [Rhodococcus sp. D2-41]MDG3009298.1 cysteine dioxygenase [Rhodococcus sp. D2-41]MDG3016915.1 cysteine dioxygenase family protein [Corynebacteriales bacterium D3-21]
MALSVADLSVPRPAGANSIAPTDLRPADLLRITDEYSDQVLAGDFDHLLPAAGLPVEQRWATRLHIDDDVDAWLISWASDDSTELHDHAGSIGALTVLSGALSEFRWAGGELKHRRLEAGDQASFPLGWVHDVVQAPGGAGDPTLSVHAYSPPLTAMSYYEPTARGTLRRTRTELTDQAESGRGGDR